MPLPNRQEVYLKRRLNRWQIFFIGLGGIIGIGFFHGSSKSMGIAGPTGALIAVVVVGIIASAVMECICELVVLWPIPNAMVEYVKSFVDEDLGVAVGIMYWYTYCVTFSTLIISMADLTNYWGIDYIFKALLYVLIPLLLIFINALPVELFGWIEYIGGIVKLMLVTGVVILMFCINGGVSPNNEHIGTKYFVDGVTYNSEVVSNKVEAVFAAIPLATFAYIGVELLTTTAFEARDPGELRLPAANVGWFSTVLYTFATGAFAANLSWKDQNLPKLFQQALTMITDPSDPSIAVFERPWPETHAAPLIAMYRVGYRFLPGFLNACFIYSAVSCANTALYVASRQLYGLTRTVSVDYDSGILRRSLAWMSSVHHRTRAPWPAIAISGLALSWLPFIRVRSDDKFIQDVQGALINIGSVGCILMWCAQCVAFIMFYHWRQYHMAELDTVAPKWNKIFEKRNGGHFRDFQPFLAYVGAGSTLFIVFFFNTVSLWNGKEILLKSLSAFVSPAVVLGIWIIRKLLRRDGRRFKFFLNLSDFSQFELRLQALEDLIYPGEGPTSVVSSLEMMTSVQRLDFFPKTDSPDTGPAVGRDGETVEMTPQPLPAYNRGNIVLSMDDDDAEDAEDTTSNQAPLTDKTYMEAPEVVHPANSDESRLRANSLSPLRPYSGTSSTRLPDVYEVEGSDDGSRLSLAKDLAR